MSSPGAVRFAPPFFCPYCGEEDIRPDDPADEGASEAPNVPSVPDVPSADGPRHSGAAGSAGAYRCDSCLRSFTLRLRSTRGGS